MAVEITTGTPLANALQSLIQPKLEALEWIGGDDSTMSEYIVMMLASGKTQDEVASELFNDFQAMGVNEATALDFSRWLFEQVHALQNQESQQAQSSLGDAMQDIPVDSQSNTDAQMGDVTQSIPTGPKAMRSGNSKQPNRRVVGQMNKAMDRSNDAALHGVRGATGSGRINAHANRDPPKGPRNQARNAHLNQLVNGGPMGRGMPMGAVGPNGPFNPLSAMSPEQQMQMVQMYEEGARMMQQQMQQMQQMMGMGGGPAVNPAFQHHGQGRGKSLFDRVQGKQSRNGSFNSNRGSKNGSQDATMGGTKEGETGQGEAMDAEGSQAVKDPSEQVCKFNLSCTKPDCGFAHQSPAAPPGTSIDMNDICSYGAACKNHKCVGKHPSPAKRFAFQAEQDCRYGPNCTNPTCPFKHSTMPLCRNGADCKTPNCKFTHSTISCKFNPCLNPSCTYKHAEGQKRGAFEDKTWIPGSGSNEHVSERKFADESVEEELIIPGASNMKTNEAAEATEATA